MLPRPSFRPRLWVPVRRQPEGGDLPKDRLRVECSWSRLRERESSVWSRTRGSVIQAFFSGCQCQPPYLWDELGPLPSEGQSPFNHASQEVSSVEVPQSCQAELRVKVLLRQGFLHSVGFRGTFFLHHATCKGRQFH